MKADLLFSSYPFISNELVTVSQIAPTDSDALWEIMGDDENYLFSPNAALPSIKEVQARMKKFDSLFRERKMIVLGIYSNANINRLVGTLELSDFRQDISCATLTFMLNQKYNGKGYATSAVKSTVKYLFEKVRINRIQSYVMPTNLPCERLMDRCGFVREGTIREGFLWPDKGIVDLDLFSILSSDYFRAQQVQQGVNPKNIVF